MVVSYSHRTYAGAVRQRPEIWIAGTFNRRLSRTMAEGSRRQMTGLAKAALLVFAPATARARVISAGLFFSAARTQ
jgi:hypothetical protein